MVLSSLLVLFATRPVFCDGGADRRIVAMADETWTKLMDRGELPPRDQDWLEDDDDDDDEEGGEGSSHSGERATRTSTQKELPGSSARRRDAPVGKDVKIEQQ